MEIFSKRLKEEREAKNLSQAQMARIMNITPQSYNQWESGKAYPTLTKFHKLCTYLEVSADYLLGLSEY